VLSPLRASEPASLYAALDLGTNNCRLLIAMPRERGFRVVDAFSRIVRLGEGIGQTGRLGEQAMSRSIEALKVCGSKLTDPRIARARLIATEACRAAENGGEFVARVQAETGLALEIVSQETEARLAVAGCASLVDPGAAGVILFDIGGGSSELVWIDLAGTSDGRRRRMADRIRAWMSLPVGVVNLSERHGGHHVTGEQFAAMTDEVADMLEGFPEGEALSEAVAGGGIHMLGTSGTVTTLAGVHLGLPRYDRRRVDGTWLTGSEVLSLVERLAEMDYDARVANPCIGRERADLVLAGCAILEAIRRRWPCERLRVADRGLREGLLVEMMAEDGVWRSRSGRRADERANA
jgi:exopolyphosphatase/guanosine-5'-triphosphate,3'-diphosphate pyrophosphatase